MATYTPTNTVDMSKERDWAASIGMMDWDSTSIVFTKRSLLEFLKYTGTTVDTNYSNIQKLPRYAKFGKITEAAPETEASAEGETAASTTEANTDADESKPSRRVRSPPGGETHDLFGHYVDDDALANAPPTDNASKSDASGTIPSEAVHIATGFRPTRRVREMPGGKDNLAGIL
ncbi:hypothetical protein BXZ70DRAFT_752540 [Cristinia sonorae]|uniref:Uncharacterized protein n=1 Tax=Cristinia sonorae TaxID=1940300 RepID=A0A8K0XSB0_9AGAR|nr:hypothetical protein BXZ70DRAFT_752540 [Cristinia sonorae]